MSDFSKRHIPSLLSAKTDGNGIIEEVSKISDQTHSCAMAKLIAALTSVLSIPFENIFSVPSNLSADFSRTRFRLYF